MKCLVVFLVIQLVLFRNFSIVFLFSYSTSTVIIIANTKMIENFIFYSSLAYNVVLNKLAFRNWFDRIDQTVILGALPFKGNFSQMLARQENVRAVISMNQDYELKMFSPNGEEWHNLGVEFLQLPTKDFVEVPSLDNLRKGVELIDKYASLNSKRMNENNLKNNNYNFSDYDNNTSLSSVYIHCKAGRTRSATLVACYLVKHNNWTAEEAVNYIRSKRSHIYLSDKHLNMIRTFRSTLFSN